MGYKCITINDNFFPGHFPERAIMPGEVVIIMPGVGPVWYQGGWARVPHAAGVLGLSPTHPAPPPPPTVPGVLQVEAMAQLAGIVMLDPEDTEGKGLFFFAGIENCRFRKPVVPGDVLVGQGRAREVKKGKIRKGSEGRRTEAS